MTESDLKADGFITRFNIDGVEVILIDVKLSNNHGFAARGVVVFALRARFQLLRVALALRRVHRLFRPHHSRSERFAAKFVRRKKFVFEIRDIWPDGAVQLGILKNVSVDKRGAAGSNVFATRAADLVVACSPGQAAHVTATGSRQKSPRHLQRLGQRHSWTASPRRRWSALLT